MDRNEVLNELCCTMAMDVESRGQRGQRGQRGTSLHFSQVCMLTAPFQLA